MRLYYTRWQRNKMTKDQVADSKEALGRIRAVHESTAQLVRFDLHQGIQDPTPLSPQRATEPQVGEAAGFSIDPSGPGPSERREQHQQAGADLPNAADRDGVSYQQSLSFLYVYAHVHVHVHVHVPMRPCTCMHTCARAHTHTHAWMHACTHGIGLHRTQSMKATQQATKTDPKRRERDARCAG